MLYKEIMKFKEIDNPLIRTSKAFLIFGKFLKKGAYMEVDCVGDDKKIEIEMQITSAFQEIENGDEGQSFFYSEMSHYVQNHKQRE